MQKSRVLIALWAIVATVSIGQAATIDSVADLATNSVIEGSDTYVLNAGDHVIGSQVTIKGDSVKNIAVDADVSLELPSGSGYYLLEVDTLKVRGGEAIVNGGTGGTVGGGPSGLYGLRGTLELDSGEVRVHGGETGYQNFGMFLTGAGSDAVTVNGGTLYAIGGNTGEDNIAIRGFGETITQNSGTVYAIGGSGGETNFGIDIEDYIQTGGTLVARAGDGKWNYGAFVDWDLVVGGELVIQRGGSSQAIAALMVGFDEDYDYGNKLEFQDGSKLVLDFAGTGLLPTIMANKVEINGTVDLEMSNTATLANGGSVTHDFLVTMYGIAGEFAYNNSATLDLSIGKSDDGKSYHFTFTRTGTAGGVAGGTPGVGSNANRFLNSLNAIYGDTSALSQLPNLSTDLAYFDQPNLSDAEIADYANYMAAKYTPVDAVSAVSNLATSVNSMAQQSMLRNVFAPAMGSGYNQAQAAAASNDAVASLAGPSGTVRSVWLTPIAQWTRTRPLTNEYSKAQENIFGAGLGLGIRQDYNFAAGISFHYLRSNLNSRTTDVDSDIYGVNVFGRKYFAECRSFAPFIEGGFGYSYVDSKQVRKALNNRSKPDSHILNGNLFFGMDLFAGNTIVTPKLGFDYNHVNTRSYRESGFEGLAVSPDNFDSFKGVIGLGIKTELSPCFFVTANAAYKHEFADRNALTTSRFTAVPDILFVTKGERRSRSSGDLGVGLGWQPRSNLLVGLNYDLYLAEKQQSHSIAARLALDF